MGNELLEAYYRKDEQMEIENTKTGEILQVYKKETPFRTITDLKGYKDGESYKPGTSKVDMTGYETLESIIARCTRVMVNPNGVHHAVIDKSLLQAEMSMPGIYEAGTEDEVLKNIDKAFASEDVTDSPNFDLADASEILHLSKLSTSANSERIPLNQATSEPVVGNLDKSDQDEINKEKLDRQDV